VIGGVRLILPLAPRPSDTLSPQGGDIIELGAIGELVGGVSVIGALAYLAVQVRQSAKSVRSASYQEAVASMSEWTQCIGADTSLATLIHKESADLSSLSEEQRLQFHYLLTSAVRKFENVHFQYRNETLDEANWIPWVPRIRGIFASEGTQAWRREQGPTYSSAFRHFVDASPGESAPLPRQPLSGKEEA